MGHSLLHVIAFVLLSSISVFNLCAQDYRPGYIITNKGDSIHGYVRYGARKNEKHADFRMGKKGQATSFTAADLKGYGFVDNKKFVSLTLPGISDQKVFARVLTEGMLTLYSYGRYLFIRKDELIALPSPENEIVQTENGQKLKKDVRYVSILNNLVSDCGLSANETKYSEGDITKLVQDYNRCKGYNPKKAPAKPLSKLNYSLAVAFSRSKMSADLDRQQVDFKPSSTFGGGIALDYSSPRTFDRLFLSLEAWYFNNHYQANYPVSFDGFPATVDISMHIKSVRGLLGIRYNFLHERSTPYVKLGLAASVFQNISGETVVTQNTGTIHTEVYREFEALETPRGFWFSFGYDHLAFGKTKLFAELRYEKLKGSYSVPNTAYATTGNFSLMLGIRF